MSRFRYFWAAIFSLFFLAEGIIKAQAILEPPFGLHWGDSPEKLVDWAARHALDVTITLPGEQPALRILRISPQKGFLPETKAGAVEGRFMSGRLFELTVHYFDPEATADMMDARFKELKKQVSNEHGNLITNQQQRLVEDKFVTRTQSFHRESIKGLMLLLAYTEVEDLFRKSKEARFSLIYRNENLRKDMMK
jgi:hypothetical protein